MRYLKTSTVVLSLDDRPLAAAQIIKGFHDFFSYAHQFWCEHLSQVAVLGKEEAASDEIQGMSRALWALFKKDTFLEGPSRTEASGSPPSDGTSMDPGLLSLLGPMKDYLFFKRDGIYPEQALCKPLGMCIPNPCTPMGAEASTTMLRGSLDADRDPTTISRKTAN